MQNSNVICKTCNHFKTTISRKECSHCDSYRGRLAYLKLKDERSEAKREYIERQMRFEKEKFEFKQYQRYYRYINKQTEKLRRGHEYPTLIEKLGINKKVKY